MKSLSFPFEFIHSRKFRTMLLALFILCGFLCGIYFATEAGPNCFLWMDTVNNRVSIVGLFVVYALPFSISALAVYYSKHIVMYVVSFWRVFIFSYCVYGLLLCYGKNAWLLAFLLMFSSHCLLPLDCWLWLKYINSDRRFYSKDFLFYSVIIIGVTMIDLFVVAPFLQTVILI